MIFKEDCNIQFAMLSIGDFLILFYEYFLKLFNIGIRYCCHVS